jgi:AraC-like DNA-binding protein
MPAQVNIFILLFGALQGILLSVWMLRYEKKKISNRYLSAFLIVVGLQLTFKVISKTWVMHNALIPYVISYKLPYLIGPLLYLFVRSRQEEKWKPLEVLHFIPFAFFTAIEFFWNGPSLHPYAQAAFQTISLGVYTILALRFSNTLVKQFIAFVASAEFIIIVTLAIMFVYYGRFPDVRLLFMVLTILIYWISYKVLSRSSLFFQASPAVMALPSRRNVKYAHSSLKAEEATRIMNNLGALMQDAKLFADASLTIDTLADRLQTSRHHLSQVINERFHKSYGDYISELRLEEARRRLRDPANLRFTIASIALDSGFNTVSSFNELFKKQFQLTPSQYRDQVLKSKSA